MVLYVGLLIYASLNPFQGWRPPESFALLVWPRYFTVFDICINIAAYVPLGILSATLWRRRAIRSAALTAAATGTLLIAIGPAAALSLTLECAQLFLPARVASPVDWLANVTGACLGALAVISSLGRAGLRRIVVLRLRYFAHRPETDWGLIVLVLWVFAQANPAIPFFEAGSIAGLVGNGERRPPYDPLTLWPQTAGVVFSVSAFALFASLLLHPRRQSILNIALMMACGLCLKLAMASLLLKTPQLVTSLSPAVAIGLVLGGLVFVSLAGWDYRWRAFCGALLTFIGALMVKLSSVYAALGETMRLFNWPHGQLANFTSLTQWVSEVWPLAALLFLCVAFLRDDNSAARRAEPSPTAVPVRAQTGRR